MVYKTHGGYAPVDSRCNVGLVPSLRKPSIFDLLTINWFPCWIRPAFTQYVIANNELCNGLCNGLCNAHITYVRIYRSPKKAIVTQICHCYISFCMIGDQLQQIQCIYSIFQTRLVQITGMCSWWLYASPHLIKILIHKHIVGRQPRF